MSDLISRRAAIDEIEYELEMINSALDSITLDFNARERLRQRRGEAREILNSIQQLPSAQPERKTGRWMFEERKRLIDETDDGPVYRTEKWWSCSECGYAKGYRISKPSSNYCENCGSPILKEGEG